MRKPRKKKKKSKTISIPKIDIFNPIYSADDGYVKKCKMGFPHSDDGPAIIYPNGTKMWYRDGWRHRDDGPAIVWADGTEEWWINGKKVEK